jgi:hypothetical protein
MADLRLHNRPSVRVNYGGRTSSEPVYQQFITGEERDAGGATLGGVEVAEDGEGVEGISSVDADPDLGLLVGEGA